MFRFVYMFYIFLCFFLFKTTLKCCSKRFKRDALCYNKQTNKKRKFASSEPQSYCYQPTELLVDPDIAATTSEETRFVTSLCIPFKIKMTPEHCWILISSILTKVLVIDEPTLTCPSVPPYLFAFNKFLRLVVQLRLIYLFQFHLFSFIFCAPKAVPDPL